MKLNVNEIQTRGLSGHDSMIYPDREFDQNAIKIEED